jgi:hypothetical protein
VLPIETGIPVPDLNASKRVYPFAEMKEGDSFLVPVPASPSETFHARRKHKQAFVAERARRYRAATGRKFTTRQVEDGVRVWRIG